MKKEIRKSGGIIKIYQTSKSCLRNYICSQSIDSTHWEARYKEVWCVVYREADQIICPQRVYPDIWLEAIFLYHSYVKYIMSYCRKKNIYIAFSKRNFFFWSRETKSLRSAQRGRFWDQWARLGTNDLGWIY